MATFWYNRGALEVGTGLTDLDTTVLKVMLVTATYVDDKDHDFASTPAANEIVATNYTGGFGGAGRKTVVIAGVLNDALNRVEYTIANLVWTALGGAVNATPTQAILIRESGSDAASPLIAKWDIGSPVATNGSDYTLTFPLAAAGGGLTMAT